MFGGHAPGQGYFGQGPQGGTNPVAVAFNAAYRLLLRIIGVARTLGQSTGRRTLAVTLASRTLQARSTGVRRAGPASGVRTIGTISI